MTSHTQIHAAPTEAQAHAVEALYSTGHSLFTAQRWADAAAVFRILLTLEPESERSWLALGECHRSAGHDAVALELYGAGVVAARPAPRCELARFRTLHDLGRGHEADAAFESALGMAQDLEDDELVEQLGIERRIRP